MTNLTVACAAGRRGAGSIDCLVCGEKIHQRVLNSPTEPWYDGEGSTEGLGDPPAFLVHTHQPAKEMGPTLGPFEYVEITYETVRIEEGETLAYFDHGRGDWVLTDLAGEFAGEAYSDLTVCAADKEV